MFCDAFRPLFTNTESCKSLFTGVLETRGTMGVQKTANNYKKSQKKAVLSEIVITSKRIIFSNILKYFANAYI